MEWRVALWLYPRFWGSVMLTRDSLAGVIRVLRNVRQLKVDDFAGYVDPKHVNNLENGKSSVSLETLEATAKVLNVSPLSLLILSKSLGNGQPSDELIVELKNEVRELTNLGVANAFTNQFHEGKLKPRSPGAKVSEDKLSSVRECKAQGLTQSQTAKQLGIPGSTVRRYWLKV